MAKNRAGLFLALVVGMSAVASACVSQPNTNSGTPTATPSGTGTGTATPTPTPTATGSATPTGQTPTPTPLAAAVVPVRSWPGRFGFSQWLVFKTDFSGSIVDWGTDINPGSNTCAGFSMNGDGFTFTNTPPLSTDPIPLAVVATNWLYVDGGAVGISGCNPGASNPHDWYFDIHDATSTNCVGGGCVTDQLQFVDNELAPNSFYNTTPTVFTAADAFNAAATGGIRMFLTNPPGNPVVTIDRVFFYTAGVSAGAEIAYCSGVNAAIGPSTEPSLIQPCGSALDKSRDPLYGFGSGTAGPYEAYMVGTYGSSETPFLQIVNINYTPFQTTNSQYP